LCSLVFILSLLHPHSFIWHWCCIILGTDSSIEYHIWNCFYFSQLDLVSTYEYWIISNESSSPVLIAWFHSKDSVRVEFWQILCCLVLWVLCQCFSFHWHYISIYHGLHYVWSLCSWIVISNSSLTQEFTSYPEIGCSCTCKKASTYSFNYILMNKLGILYVFCASWLSGVYITSENA